jgi:peptidyl-prolyl cis-trans isomerase A (cyclophilin A)
VKHHFYDGAAFFRVLPDFVAQFGISPRPEISRVWHQATIPDDPVTRSNARGTLTFATGGPNTRTTQVFINLTTNSNLDGMGFSPFGKVIDGMKVVDKLYSRYGDGAPRGNGPAQDRIQREGKAYLEKEFPKLDTITTAVIVPEAAAGARKSWTKSWAATLCASCARPSKLRARCRLESEERNEKKPICHSRYASN